ncbi:alcohol dehydrogenase catalytic domain-containing protein [Pedobacter nutrimenti]|uniref:S-(Hydroxymethyl)glutathione dehydrogenase/alcohol dehydrogenase n=1 Tax=Pedobacter nutrimenti TaxID=1241337 RepID=A0A318USY1_9SPHI|nr:alcohol dehydrogenase catalytic domain-containing protein [Pedobacter nutrimenti]PYF74719.1 S-(hydroxymethyl)glutathione dehydrogenase/alcohol dehydrogenase [Pedobacter nutrimenti]
MPIHCKAAITRGKQDFSIEEIIVADPAPDEILVQIKAAGLCHTDYDSLNWGKTMILGHEGAGLVVKAGSAVTDFKTGDPVILNWAMSCGHCFQCGQGNVHLCENNSPVTGGTHGPNTGHAHAMGTTQNNVPIQRSFNLGTLSEYTLVKAAAAVLNTAAEMSFPAASILSCGVMTGYGSVVNAARVRPGSTVVVLGSGGVGLSVIQAARISGAVKIIAIDINPARLEMASTFGATHLILANSQDQGLISASLQVKEICENRGADYAFECTARPELGAAPLAMVRNAGTAIQVSGIEQSIPFDMNLFEWDKIYMNPLYGKCKPQIDFPALIALYSDKQLMLEEMITRTYPLTELKQAFQDMLQGKNAKGVIIF